MNEKLDSRIISLEAGIVTEINKLEQAQTALNQLQQQIAISNQKISDARKLVAELRSLSQDV